MNLSKIKEYAVRFGKKAWEYIKLAKIELIVLVAALVVDLVSKAIVAGSMYEGQTVVLIPKFFNFTFIYNELAAFGGAFGLDKLIGVAATRVIFIILTFAAVGIFSYFMYRARGKSKLQRVALALIISGALGNLVDRLFIGKVRDFMEIVFFGCDVPLLGTSFAIFNVADMALVVGVILFLVYYLFLHKEPKEEDDTAAVSAAEKDDAPSADKDTALPEEAGTEEESSPAADTSAGIDRSGTENGQARAEEKN